MSPGGTLAAPFDPNAEVPVLPSDLMEPDDRATGVGEAAQEEVAADGGDGAEEEPEAAAEANDAGAGEEEWGLWNTWWVFDSKTCLGRQLVDFKQTPCKT